MRVIQIYSTWKKNTYIYCKLKKDKLIANDLLMAKIFKKYLF